MSKLSRRDILQAGVGAGVVLGATAARPSSPAAPEAETKALRLDASSAPSAPREAKPLPMGTARRPDGREITVDSLGLRRDGKPWLPVMGEFHYARYPASEWRDALLRIRAGGIDIVATYVFWIHHEEEQGHWAWSERRSLRDFIKLCGQCGLHAVVRCGPWCHGEVRNGGLPDWILKKGVRTRSDDPDYLEAARRFYQEIAGQLQGLLWKDGGPVIGIQCENEYSGPAQHLLTLKALAQEVGLDVPLYTRTGWPNLRTPMPFGQLVPLYGGYADGFWDRSLAPMPGAYGDAFRFVLERGEAAAAIGTDQLGAHGDKDEQDTPRYPYFCCEIGGGMERSYHRRIRIAPRDIESTALVKIGAGNNLQGYYMYHGGTNPEGKLSTLQESQATNYWNDVPVRSYDFQAPLGEFGQVREHYHRLRRLHLFLQDYGPALTNMAAHLPETGPTNARDTETLRWAARTDGHSGFVFVNNYQRLQPMPAKAGVQFHLQLPGGALQFPREPVTVPADSVFFWPFRMEMEGATLVYATAQSLCRLTVGDTDYRFFVQTTGVPAEFVFEGSGLTLESAAGKTETSGGQIRVRDVRVGMSIALRLRTAAGKRICIVLLDEETSLTCWKETLRNQECLLFSRADLLLEDGAVRLRASDPDHLTLVAFSPPSTIDGVEGAGFFRRYRVAPEAPREAVKLSAEQLQAAGPARVVKPGSQGVSEAPTDADFDQAAVWRITLPKDTDPSRDLLLQIRYTGDVARLYLDGKLLTDNFYNGAPFELGLKRYAPEIYQNELLLKILPLRKDTPLYLPDEARPDFSGAEETALALEGITVIERYEGRLNL